MNRKDLRAPTLAGPTGLYQGSGPCSCNTPHQLTNNEPEQVMIFLLNLLSADGPQHGMNHDDQPRRRDAHSSCD